MKFITDKIKEWQDEEGEDCPEINDNSVESASNIFELFSKICLSKPSLILCDDGCLRAEWVGEDQHTQYLAIKFIGRGEYKYVMFDKTGKYSGLIDGKGVL